MGLFKKEKCCLCDGKTGLLDKKCADGKVCKDCRTQLSVWFEDYKKATANDLRAQLAQKEADIELAPTLHFNKVFGEMGCILIDEEHRLFTVFADTSTRLFGDQRDVHTIQDVLDLRPDLISFDQVRDIEIDITETFHEHKQTVDGEQVSYDPPHYEYMYIFHLRFDVDHPYVQRPYLALNSSSVKVKTTKRRVWSNPGKKLAAWFFDAPELVPENLAAYYDNDSLQNFLYHSPYEIPDLSFGFRVTNQNHEELRRYYYYLLMAHNIRNTILGDLA